MVCFGPFDDDDDDEDDDVVDDDVLLLLVVRNAREFYLGPLGPRAFGNPNAARWDLCIWSLRHSQSPPRTIATDDIDNDEDDNDGRR